MCCISLCCPHAQNESAYIAHVVKVYHDMLYWSIVSTLSECLTICCISPRCQSVSSYIAPCGQGVSRYVVSIRAVYMVRMKRRILPMWSGCITLYRVDSYCSRGHNGSQPMRSECLTICCINSLCLHGQYVSRYICPVWSECVTIYLPRVVSISHNNHASL